MKLVIVESPKKAKTIKNFLPKDFKVISSYGHIYDLPKNEFGISIKNGNLYIKYKVIKWHFIKKLKSLLKYSKEVFLATDPDREGEFIAWSIKLFLKNKNVYRLRFYEITKNAIYQAFKNKDKINNNLVNSQKSRRCIDRIIGYTISPILWKHNIGKSCGRVQSAALRIIVERELEIKNFKPKKYYHLIADFSKFKAYLIDNKNNHIFKDKDHLEKILEKIKEDKFKIKEILKKEKILKKPLPLDTAKLQRVAFLKYNFSSPFTMKLAQNLYEKGLITYHRTDSYRLSKNFLNEIKNYLKEKYEEPISKKEKFSQEAHEAIRPTQIENIPKLNKYEKLLFDLILKYTLSSCSKNALIEETNIYLFPQNHKEFIFKTTGEKIKEYGYLEFFPFKIKFNSLPNIALDKELKPSKIYVEEKETKPPARYTESSLIKELKKLGIGRPSTYAEIIKILYKRNYVIKEKNSLKPTEIGIKVIEFLRKNFPEIIDLKLTSKMEKDLDKIRDGKIDFEKYVIDFWNKIKSLL